MKDGHLNGRGKLFYKDGSIFEGGFAESKKHGAGVWIFPDGRRVEGNWIYNNLEGYGKIVFPDGQTKWGVLEDGKIRLVEPAASSPAKSSGNKQS